MKIVRIVRMTFRNDAIDEFQTLFNAYKDQIRHFEGCTHLELLRDADDPRIFYTYSHWDTAGHLDSYRESELFGNVWPRTRALFEEKPVAFSMILQQEIK